MKNIQSKIITLLFIIGITTPLLIMQISDNETVSLVEKRKLAKKATFNLSISSLKQFRQQHEEYVNDHFGLRNELIKLYNGIFVYLFKTSPTNTVIVGKEKWLFFPIHALQDFTGSRPLDINTLRQRKQTLFDREQWLAQREIHYLFLPIPHKLSIYPEYLPSRIQKLHKETNLEQLVSHLTTAPRFSNFLDLQPTLLKAKKAEKIYHEADTHWNMVGAYIGYTEIINHIRQWFPEIPPPVQRDQLIKVKKQFSGNLTKYLNVTELYKENVEYYKLPKYGKKVEFKTIKNYPQHDLSAQHVRKGLFYTSENKAQKLTAVFISDSFGGYLKEFLPHHFKKIFFVKVARFEDVKELIENEKPDIVIDLKVTRDFWVAFGENISIRNQLESKTFKSSNHLFDASAETLLQRLESTHNAKVIHESAQKRIRVNGSDPQLYFDFPDHTSEGILHLYCNITSPADTTLQIYYQTPNQQYYSSEKVISTDITKGTNDVYLRIFEPVLLNNIRIDPGETVGTYSINSFSIVEEQATFTDLK